MMWPNVGHVAYEPSVDVAVCFVYFVKLCNEENKCGLLNILVTGTIHVHVYLRYLAEPMYTKILSLPGITKGGVCAPLIPDNNAWICPNP